MILRLPALCCLVFLAAGIRGQEDFDLGDAFAETTPHDHLAPTQKPGDDTDKKPTVKPQPDRGGGGGFGDTDLIDAAGGLPPNDPSGHDEKSGRGMKTSGGEDQGQGGDKQSLVAGIVSAVGVAAVGAVTSFVAYQKKKLCFKGAAEDPENVNMEAHKGEQAEPQVQSTLLAK